jgi:hypothetical protein
MRLGRTLLSKLACWLGVYVISSASFNLLLASAGTRAKFLRLQSPCAAHMVDGHEYQISGTIFHWTGSNGDVYADAIGYYVPGSGEFLWWALEYNKRGYDRDLKHDPYLKCAADRHDIVELVDGELVDFYGGNSQIRVFHSKLHFPSLRRAWQYVAEHPEDTSQMLGGKWLTMISLAEIGDDFFRPERSHLMIVLGFFPASTLMDCVWPRSPSVPQWTITSPSASHASQYCAPCVVFLQSFSILRPRTISFAQDDSTCRQKAKDGSIEGVLSVIAFCNNYK